MESNSLRLVPSSFEGPSTTASVKNTANSLGTHDTLRYGQKSLASDAMAGNGLQRRLENWEETQDNLKLNMQRSLYGMHAPVRLLMERKIVSANPHMPALPQTNIGLDILMGRDESLDVGDFFGEMERGPAFDIHGDMEKKRRL